MPNPPKASLQATLRWHILGHIVFCLMLISAAVALVHLSFTNVQHNVLVTIIGYGLLQILLIGGITTRRYRNQTRYGAKEQAVENVKNDFVILTFMMCLSFVGAAATCIIHTYY